MGRRLWGVIDAAARASRVTRDRRSGARGRSAAGARALAGLLAACLALALAAAPAGAAEWLAGDLHVHTTYSHDAWGGPGDEDTGPEDAHTLGHSVEGQFLIAASRGLDYLAITDHNDVRSVDDPGFGAFGLIPVSGYEASLRGHAQMLGATRVYDSGRRTAADVRRIAAQLRASPDRGVLQVNHPAEGSTDFPHDADWGYGYEVAPDAVEVWNISALWQPPLPSASSNDDAVRYWEGWLDRGRRVAATGGSDSHWVSTTAVQGAGQPTTWVLAEERSLRGILEGLRRGRTFISHQPPAHGGPRLFLEADSVGDGSFAATVGDRVLTDSPLRARVLGAPGTELHVVVDGGEELEAVPVTGQAFEHRFRAPAGATWVRAELIGPDLAAERRALCDDALGGETTYCRNRLLRLALTSAIYLRD